MSLKGFDLKEGKKVKDFFPYGKVLTNNLITGFDLEDLLTKLEDVFLYGNRFSTSIIFKINGEYYVESFIPEHSAYVPVAPNRREVAYQCKDLEGLKDYFLEILKGDYSELIDLEKLKVFFKQIAKNDVEIYDLLPFSKWDVKYVPIDAYADAVKTYSFEKNATKVIENQIFVSGEILALADAKTGIVVSDKNVKTGTILTLSIKKPDLKVQSLSKTLLEHNVDAKIVVEEKFKLLDTDSLKVIEIKPSIPNKNLAHLLTILYYASPKDYPFLITIDTIASRFKAKIERKAFLGVIEFIASIFKSIDVVIDASLSVLDGTYIALEERGYIPEYDKLSEEIENKVAKLEELKRKTLKLVLGEESLSDDELAVIESTIFARLKSNVKAKIREWTIKKDPQEVVKKTHKFWDDFEREFAKTLAGNNANLNAFVAIEVAYERFTKALDLKILDKISMPIINDKPNTFFSFFRNLDLDLTTVARGIVIVYQNFISDVKKKAKVSEIIRSLTKLNKEALYNLIARSSKAKKLFKNSEILADTLELSRLLFLIVRKWALAIISVRVSKLSEMLSGYEKIMEEFQSAEGESPAEKREIQEVAKTNADEDEILASSIEEEEAFLRTFEPKEVSEIQRAVIEGNITALERLIRTFSTPEGAYETIMNLLIQLEEINQTIINTIAKYLEKKTHVKAPKSFKEKRKYILDHFKSISPSEYVFLLTEITNNFNSETQKKFFEFMVFYAYEKILNEIKLLNRNLYVFLKSKIEEQGTLAEFIEAFLKDAEKYVKETIFGLIVAPEITIPKLFGVKERRFQNIKPFTKEWFLSLLSLNVEGKAFKEFNKEINRLVNPKKGIIASSFSKLINKNNEFYRKVSEGLFLIENFSEPNVNLAYANTIADFFRLLLYRKTKDVDVLLKTMLVHSVISKFSGRKRRGVDYSLIRIETNLEEDKIENFKGKEIFSKKQIDEFGITSLLERFIDNPEAVLEEVKSFVKAIEDEELWLFVKTTEDAFLFPIGKILKIAKFPEVEKFYNDLLSSNVADKLAKFSEDLKKVYNNYLINQESSKLPTNIINFLRQSSISALEKAIFEYAKAIARMQVASFLSMFTSYALAKRVLERLIENVPKNKKIVVAENVAYAIEPYPHPISPNIPYVMSNLAITEINDLLSFETNGIPTWIAGFFMDTTTETIKNVYQKAYEMRSPSKHFKNSYKVVDVSPYATNRVVIDDYSKFYLEYGETFKDKERALVLSEYDNLIKFSNSVKMTLLSAGLIELLNDKKAVAKAMPTLLNSVEFYNAYKMLKEQVEKVFNVNVSKIPKIPEIKNSKVSFSKLALIDAIVDLASVSEITPKIFSYLRGKVGFLWLIAKYNNYKELFNFLTELLKELESNPNHLEVYKKYLKGEIYSFAEKVIPKELAKAVPFVKSVSSYVINNDKVVKELVKNLVKEKK